MNIKETWKEHPLYEQGKIALLPTEWVWKYYGRDVLPEMHLADGETVSMDALWQNILDKGLRDPLIMRVGLGNNKARLEAGNHRIQVLREHGVSFVPVTVQVRDECGPHVSDVMTNATHNIDVPEGFLIAAITDEYMNPKDVFKNLK